MSDSLRHDYAYVDERGTLLFTVVRIEQPGQAKRIFQQTPDGRKPKDVRKVPYRLPDLLNPERGEFVFIVEGEKKADALRQWGLVATCNSGGAGKWLADFAEHFRHTDSVVILPDNDDPGRKHAISVAASLHGAVKRVRIVELPHLPDKGDVIDWIASGGTKDKLWLYVSRAEDWQPSHEDIVDEIAADFPDGATGTATRKAIQLNGTRSTAVEPLTIDAVLGMLQGVIPSGDGYKAHCPAHDDRTPSLCVSTGNKKIVLTCHAGCSYDAILSALGINQQQLYYDPPIRQSADAQASDTREGNRKETQAEKLIKLVTPSVTLFHFDDVPYGGYEHNGHVENYPVHSTAFKRYLSYRFYSEFQRGASADVLSDTTCTLAAKAMFEGEQIPTAIRIGEHCGNVYLDLCDDAWRAVEISPDGWRIVSNPPVKFIRRGKMLPLPVPVAGGSIEELRPLINADDDANWILMVSWLIGAFCPSGPYTILTVNGEHGSAKTCTSTILRRLIDPNTADLRGTLKNVEDLAIAASNSWIVGLDNLSGIDAGLADSLCRVSTGDAFSTRKLYTNDEEHVFEFCRPIVINGINDLSSRPDLLERAVPVVLSRLQNHMEEKELFRRFDDARPRILGAILSAVSVALANRDKVAATKLPRMADFARWVIAAEQALPWQPGAFLDTFTAAQSATLAYATDDNVLTPYLATLLTMKHGHWTGTASDLLRALNYYADDPQTQRRKDWPMTPHGLSGSLRRMATGLLQRGISVKFDRTREKRTLTLRLIEADVQGDTLDVEPWH